MCVAALVEYVQTHHTCHLSPPAPPPPPPPTRFTAPYHTPMPSYLLESHVATVYPPSRHRGLHCVIVFLTACSLGRFENLARTACVASTTTSTTSDDVRGVDAYFYNFGRHWLGSVRQGRGALCFRVARSAAQLCFRGHIAEAT